MCWLLDQAVQGSCGASFQQGARVHASSERSQDGQDVRQAVRECLGRAQGWCVLDDDSPVRLSLLSVFLTPPFIAFVDIRFRSSFLAVVMERSRCGI